MLNLIIASTYLHKGSKKHPPPCGKHAKSQQLIFIRDENEDEDEDDDDDDDHDHDHDHDHGSHIHLHIESPPTWHSKIHNPSAIPGWSNVRVAPNMFKRIH